MEKTKSMQATASGFIGYFVIEAALKYDLKKMISYMAALLIGLTVSMSGTWTHVYSVTKFKSLKIKVSSSGN